MFTHSLGFVRSKTNFKWFYAESWKYIKYNDFTQLWHLNHVLNENAFTCNDSV